MNDKAPNQVSKKESPSAQVYTRLENLAHKEMAEPDDNGLYRFRVGDLSVGGVTVTIDSKAHKVDLIGALRHGDPTRSVQITKHGAEGSNLGFEDNGNAPEPIDEASAISWANEVASGSVEPGVAA